MPSSVTPPTLKIVTSSWNFSIYRLSIQTSINDKNTTKYNHIWAQDNPDILTFNNQFYLRHYIKYFSKYNKVKGTFFFKKDYICICSKH